MRNTTCGLLLALAGLGATLRASVQEPAPKPPFQPPKRIGTLPTKTIPEASGLARSRNHAGIFWTHNDSGGKPDVFAVRADGTLVREVAVPGAKNFDWEDIGLDGKNRIVVADIGDNYHARDELALYRFAEPDPASRDPIAAVETIRFRYPRGFTALDAEALFISADTAFVLTKGKNRSHLFRIPLPADAATKPQPIEAELIGTFEDLPHVTAACLADDGRHLAILTYLQVVVIDLPAPFRPDLPVAQLFAQLRDAPRRTQHVFLGQCEGIAFDGQDLVVATEKGPFTWGLPLLWRLVPAAPNPTPAAGSK